MWFVLVLGLLTFGSGVTSLIAFLGLFFPELLAETKLYEFSSASWLESKGSSGTFYDYFPFGTATIEESKIGASISRLFAFESVFNFLF